MYINRVVDRDKAPFLWGYNPLANVPDNFLASKTAAPLSAVSSSSAIAFSYGVRVSDTAGFGSLGSQKLSGIGPFRHLI